MSENSEEITKDDTMKEIPQEIIKEITKDDTMKEIPEELIKEIIFMVPVKSLLKFRCVSPSWLSVIDSPCFIKTHLLKSTPKIILNAPDDSCFVLDIKNFETKPTCESSVLKLCYSETNNYIFGSCNGVILTHHNKKESTVLFPFDNRRDVVLQNPSTRTFQKIQFVQHKFSGPKDVVCAPERFFYGIGYDALADDYKVFRNCQFYGTMSGNPFYSQVHVYSMKMKTFKQIEPFPYYIYCPMDESIFAGGALHWVVSSSRWDKNLLIASFDVSTEGYRIVEQLVYSSGKFKLYLHVLGGCLSVVCSYLDLELLEVWVMEYGNAESWSKLLSLMIGVKSIDYLKPLLYSECGKKLLVERDCRKLIWYDLEKNSAIVEMDCHHVPKQFKSLVHFESLVKLSCRVPADDKRRACVSADDRRGAEHKDEKPTKMRKKRDDFLSKGFKLKL